MVKGPLERSISKEQQDREMLVVKAAFASSSQGSVKTNVLGPGNGVLTLPSRGSTVSGDILLGSDSNKTPSSRSDVKASFVQTPRSTSLSPMSANQSFIGDSSKSRSFVGWSATSETIVDGQAHRKRQFSDMIGHASGNLSRYSNDLVHGNICLQIASLILSGFLL